MSRPRTATNILEARGAFRQNPQRKRPNEPKSTSPFPKTAPKALTIEERKCWREVVRICPAGVLTGSDTLTVEIVARLLAELREDSRSMPIARMSRLTAEMNKIGLSPSSRAALTVDKPKQNDFDDV